jgi:hypothetical protein
MATGTGLNIESPWVSRAIVPSMRRYVQIPGAT